MFNSVIIVLQGAPRVIRWVDENTLNFPAEILFKGFKSQQIVTTDEAVIRPVTIESRFSRGRGLLIAAISLGQGLRSFL